MTGAQLGVSTRYAYVVETIDDHDSQWCEFPEKDGLEPGSIERSAGSDESFAAHLAGTYLDHVRDHLDDVDEMSLAGLRVRVSLWRVDEVLGLYWPVPEPENYPAAVYFHALRAARIPADLVQIRTADQVHAHLYARRD